MCNHIKKRVSPETECKILKTCILWVSGFLFWWLMLNGHKHHRKETMSEYFDRQVDDALRNMDPESFNRTVFRAVDRIMSFHASQNSECGIISVPECEAMKILRDEDDKDFKNSVSLWIGMLMFIGKPIPNVTETIVYVNETFFNKGTVVEPTP